MLLSLPCTNPYQIPLSSSHFTVSKFKIALSAFVAVEPEKKHAIVLFLCVPRKISISGTKMKGMRGRLLKTLQSVRPIGYLKQDRVLQVSASDGYVVDSWSKSSVHQEHNQIGKKVQEQSKLNQKQKISNVQEPDIIDVSELMKDLEDEEMELEDSYDDKENMGPPEKQFSVHSKKFSHVSSETEHEQSGIQEETEHVPLSEIDISSFRRPDLNSGSLFDPKLLAAFRQAVRGHIRMVEEERRVRVEEQPLGNIEEDDEAEQEPPLKARRIEEDQSQNLDPLLEFEEKCPPGGDGTVIFYTTSLRGIRKTFEDCNSVRFLLETFRVVFFERDISMHMEFKDELKRVLEGQLVVPPKLFIKGRYIGGAEEVLKLHEQGKFRPLLEGVPIDRSTGPCEGCAGLRFVLCFRCSGSRRMVSDDGSRSTCPECNENGLMICPYCC